MRSLLKANPARRSLGPWARRQPLRLRRSGAPNVQPLCRRRLRSAPALLAAVVTIRDQRLRRAEQQAIASMPLFSGGTCEEIQGVPRRRDRRRRVASRRSRERVRPGRALKAAAPSGAPPATGNARSPGLADEFRLVAAKSNIAPTGVPTPPFIGLRWRLCEHAFVTSQGHAHARFRRALERGNATEALSAAAELPQVGLTEALELCLLLRDDGAQEGLDLRR